MGLFGRGQKGPNVPLAEYRTEAMRVYRRLLDHYASVIDRSMVLSADDLRNAEVNDPHRPRGVERQTRGVSAAWAIAHRAARQDLIDRRYQHLTVLMADRPYVDAAMISQLEPQMLAHLKAQTSLLDESLFKYYMAAPYYRNVTWHALNPPK